MKVPLRVRTIEQKVAPDDYGWKAYWLSWLYHEGYDVPWAIFVPAFKSETAKDASSSIDSILVPKILAPLRDGAKYRVAVRSSATNEDTKRTSMAGHFKSFLGSMSRADMIRKAGEVVGSLIPYQDDDNSRMGVVIQKLIEPSFSGVLFSSNPVTASKLESIISVVRGRGEALVSGKRPAEDILVSFTSKKLVVGKHRTRIAEGYLRRISFLGKEIENKLRIPVDIEWCVEESSSKLYLLQVRPATGILPSGPNVIPVTLKHESQFPQFVSQDPKVTLRLMGERRGVFVSHATLVVMTCSDPPIIPDVTRISPSKYCKGYSVVLIYPKTVSGKVVRFFQRPSTNSNELEVFMEGCQRYQIRSYPQMDSLNNTLSSIEKSCHDYSWLGIAIVQEIFDPLYTGIIRKISDGYVVELAFGHFVPKGVVPTSQYVTNDLGAVVHKSETHQDRRLRIIDGHIIDEKLLYDESLVTVAQNTIYELVRTFKPFLRTEKTSVEFGLLSDFENSKRGHLFPYLIDFGYDSGPSGLNSTDISSGIMSRGKITGRLLSALQPDSGTDSLNVHLYDSQTATNVTGESVVFLCERPDISLLGLVREYAPERIGFIFREGSMLCHLAIVLRERAIPALIIGDISNLRVGEKIKLDCSTPGLKPIERVTPVG